jgi:hypothetical protein
LDLLEVLLVYSVELVQLQVVAAPAAQSRLLAVMLVVMTLLIGLAGP